MNGSLIQETSSDGCELVQRNAFVRFGNSSVFNFSKETGSALSLLSSQRCLKGAVSEKSDNLCHQNVCDSSFKEGHSTSDTWTLGDV